MTYMLGPCRVPGCPFHHDVTAVRPARRRDAHLSADRAPGELRDRGVPGARSGGGPDESPLEGVARSVVTPRTPPTGGRVTHVTTAKPMPVNPGERGLRAPLSGAIHEPHPGAAPSGRSPGR